MLNFGKPENDGFIDGAARYVVDALKTTIILFLIYLVLKDFFTAIIRFNVKKLVIYGSIICFIYLMAFMGKKQKEDFKSRPNSTYQIDYLGV